MVLRIAGKNLDIGQALRTRIEETVTGTVQKYFDRGYSGQVTVSKSGACLKPSWRCISIPGMTFEVHGADIGRAREFRSGGRASGKAASALQAASQRPLTQNGCAWRPIKVLQ